MTTSLLVMIACRRLHWLSHIAWIDDVHVPRQFLFGWLPNPHHTYGFNEGRRDQSELVVRVICLFAVYSQGPKI